MPIIFFEKRQSFPYLITGKIFMTFFIKTILNCRIKKIFQLKTQHDHQKAFFSKYSVIFSFFSHMRTVPPLFHQPVWSGTNVVHGLFRQHSSIGKY